MIDISQLPNPYDFANPVSDPDLFVGRKLQLDEIRYYLDHAKRAQRPINLALLGERASGKTSLLNMTEIEARRRGFCVVRVDLDEDDAKSQLAFFFKLFDTILAAACESGAFGGLGSKTYDQYLDIVNSYVVPDDKTFCPFLFPIQYAKAMAARNLHAPISAHNYRGDILKISAELARPVIVLFDESNVLANSRIHLEKLRNLFMNTPGYMLVLAGTPSLFPVIDEVFSPIVRQFKKIEVKQFEDHDETAQCIRKPLEKIGINNPRELFEFETFRDVQEIHSLSGGRPYEIQLICHLLFRRLQAKRGHKMRLSFSVLEDVRAELETSQDISSRPILTKIKSCTKDQLSCLELLCSCEGHGTFEQVWSINSSFGATGDWTKDSLLKELNKFVEIGILGITDGIICFNGDYFDRVYSKYCARESGVTLAISSTSVPQLIDYQFFLLSTRIKGLQHLAVGTKEGSSDFKNIAASLGAQNPKLDIFEEGPSYLDELYVFMFRNRDRKVGEVLRATLEFPWATSEAIFIATKVPEEEIITKATEVLKQLESRSLETGAKLTFEILEIPIVPLETMTAQVRRTSNEAFRRFIARVHIFSVIARYLDGDIQEALLNAELALDYGVEVAPEEANNLGYLFLVTGQLDRAQAFLDIGVAAVTYSTGALANYNLAVLLMKRGNLEKALIRLNECISLIRDARASGECSCLLAVTYADQQVQFKEIRSPGVPLAVDTRSDEDEPILTENVSILQYAETARDCLMNLLS